MTSLLRITLTATFVLGIVLLAGFTAHHCGERHECALKGGKLEEIDCHPVRVGMGHATVERCDELCVVSLPERAP